jgi:hypothetical protein
MSTSQHPVAQRLERQFGDDTRLLATVMGLPLVDGIFPALVLAGALGSGGSLTSYLGVVEVGLLVFGGSATAAVVLAELEGSPRETVPAVALVGLALVTVAAVEAALAPTIASLVDLATFERFAALVIAAIAAKTASATVGEYLPSPGVVIGLGLLASLDPANAAFVFRPDPELVARAAGAAAVGSLFALGLATFAPRLRAAVDIDRFRFGSAVALGLLPLSILGLSVGGAPLAVIAVTALFAYDPDGGQGTDAAASSSSGAAADSPTPADPEAAATDGGRAAAAPASADEGDAPADESATAGETDADSAATDSHPPWR